MAEDKGHASASASGQSQFTMAPTSGIVKDHIYITEGGELRTIAVSASIPEAMARQGQWRVDDFDLHKELYRGKTSLLYMATDRRSGIQVALKLYRKRKLSTLNRYQVEREIRIHIQLDHVNIIKLFAAFEDEKNVYMVQEFAGGGDLFEDLKRNGGTIKEKYTVRDIVVPFLNALQYLHGLGIIHRDIKPENILLTTQRVIKIADFGLSIAYTQERPVTRAGTLDYMAPEVLICPDKRRPEENKDKVLLAYTAQVDAWAVGILCYELMVGYPPFEQESRAATYEHIMYKEPKFPAWMSEDAKKFISTALCKNATQRPTITDLGKQPLVLLYAKPVDKPLEARLPQEFLVERSARSVMSPLVSPAAAAAPSPSASTTHHPSTPAAQPLAINLQPLGMKRPGTLDTDDCGSSGSLDSPKSLLSPKDGKREVKLSANGKASNSGMILDEDASYSITDFATPPPDDGGYYSMANGSTSPTKSGQHAPPITRIPSSNMRGLGSPLAKSRLSGVSQGGAAPAGLSLPQGKVSPLLRASPLASAPGNSNSSEQLHVEVSSGSYYKPQGGILSDDSAVPMARQNSLSGSATPGAPPSSGTRQTAMSSGSKGGVIMERPPLDKLLGGSSEEPSTPDDGGSKYSKLFAKMWGGKASDKAQNDPSPSLGSFSKIGKPLKHGMRTLQEELLAERQDSLLVMDSRTGSVVGAPAMNFKKPSQAAIQARTAVEAAAAALEKPDKLREAKAALFANPRASLLADDFGPQRMNSEALLARVGVGATSSGRSFTSSSSPTMKKLANAPIVNKIHDYVAAQNHSESL